MHRFYYQLTTKLRHSVSNNASSGRYEARIVAEKKFYKNCTNVHELPEIFHYWSNRYLRPKVEQLGFSHPDMFFQKYMEKSYISSRDSRRAFVSIGAGNCDTEVRLAKGLLSKGVSEFVIHCLDINETMLERGQRLAEENGVTRNIQPLQADFNRWEPSQKYDAVIAHQALHHVLNLEHLFGAIAGSMKPNGLFITSDMIGRNGHMRWPEALEVVQQFWGELPEAYRYNHQLNRYEEVFENWDCSKGGFEGIRAQDILPLLVERFSFDLFLGFSNIIDPFIDRGFGHNFDASRQWDRSFIDRVHAWDEAELTSGRVKPTHMFAVMCVGRRGKSQYLGGMSPEFCVRWPS